MQNWMLKHRSESDILKHEISSDSIDTRLNIYKPVLDMDKKKCLAFICNSFTNKLGY